MGKTERSDKASTPNLSYMYCSSVGDLEFLCSRRRRGSSSRPGVHVITHPKSHRCEPNETCHKWKVTHGAPLWSVVVRQVRALVATRNARSNARMHRGEPTARHTDHPTHNNASITLHVPVKRHRGSRDTHGRLGHTATRATRNPVKKYRIIP